MAYTEDKDEFYEPPSIQEVRKQRLEKVKSGEPRPFYVVVYGIDRLYAGPQEDGDWWDRIECLECSRVWSVKQALQEIRYLKEEYPPPRRNRYSVIGGTDIEIRVIPTKDFIYEQLTKPRWE